jgi:fumarate reductase flavoprotein subunit
MSASLANHPSGRPWDVVVVGAGLAGCCASLSAAEQGAAVLLVEKMPAPGGSSRLSGGGFAFAGIPPQREQGIADTPELLRSDMQRLGDGFADPALVDAYVTHQAATYDWLCASGVRFTTLQTGSGNSVPRVLRSNTQQLFEALTQAVSRQPGIAFHSGLAAERLLMEDGTVAGIRLNDGHRAHDVRAAGVVLASGGFSRNLALTRTFAPGALGAVPVGGDGSTGDGLRMACAAGAGLRDMGFVRPTFGSHPKAEGATNLVMHPIYKGAVIVNQRGERFVDESRPYKELGELLLGQPGRIGWQVFDQTVMDKADPLSVTYDFRGALAKGLVLEAASLADLARAMAVDGATLARSIAVYNAAISSGEPDPHGRTGLPGGGPRTTIDRAPYFAFPSVAVLLATYCGIAIDPDARVLDAFGAPIPGLFAAGEVTGGVHGAGYLSGTSLGKAAIFGRLAGARAAAAARQPGST